MTTYYGTGTWLGFGEESPWGTAVARTTWDQAVSAELRRTPEIIRVPHLIADTTSMMSKAKRLIKEDAGGSFEILMRYRGQGLILKSIFGSVTDAGAGPYTHTFKLGDPRTPTGLTIEQIIGDSGNSEVFAGCVPTKATMTFNPNDYARLRLDVLAKTATARSSAGTPSAGDDVPILGSHVGSFTWNSVAYVLRNLEITVDRKWARRDLLGSLYTASPTPTDLGDIRVRLTLDAEAAFYTALVAGTEADGTCTITDATDILAVTLHNAYVASVSEPLSSHGIVSQTVELVAQSDGTDDGLQLVLTNPDALYSTP